MKQDSMHHGKACAATWIPLLSVFKALIKILLILAADFST